MTIFGNLGSKTPKSFGIQIYLYPIMQVLKKLSQNLEVHQLTVRWDLQKIGDVRKSAYSIVKGEFAQCLYSCVNMTHNKFQNLIYPLPSPHKKVKKVQLKEAKFWKRKSPNTNSITISNRPTLFCFILLEKNNSLSLLFVNYQLSTVNFKSTVNCQLSTVTTCHF